MLWPVLENYEVLQELWTLSVEKITDTEMKARIQGVAAKMMKFDFFFGVSLGEVIMRHTDNLRRALQQADISASKGQQVAGLAL